MQGQTLIDLRAKLPDRLHPLIKIAYNFWWSWDGVGVSIFRELNSQHWENCNHNPVEFLATLLERQLLETAADPSFLQRLHDLSDRLENYLQQRPTRIEEVAREITPDRPIAYFCIEFGLHQCLATYAGGLGILAADYLKSASDLGLPTVGVGLLYRRGYFQQRFNSEGWQEEHYPDAHFARLPLKLMSDDGGEPLTVNICIRQRCVTAQIWQIQIGRIELYLLDTDREDNDPLDRSLTSRLYGGDDNTRISQEILLGIGGMRALQQLNIAPSIIHLNEGHSAFALLESIRQTMANQEKSFEEAKAEVQQRCVFTTHTPVMAGHDIFPAELMDEYFSHYWSELQISGEKFLDLGARKPQEFSHPFNMTVLALRLTRAANGVSQLNGKVCRQMWSAIYPEKEVPEVPIGAITNGVHVASWIAPLMADLYDRYLGRDWLSRLCDRQIWEKIARIPAAELWECHQLLKERLIVFARERIACARARREATRDEVESDRLLDPQALTIGFARRLSAYKRPDLIMYDSERARKILSDRQRPVRLIFAGKAHPANDESKRILQRAIEWSHHPDIRDRVVFLENYDILTAQRLVQGVDLWLNTPQRPLEASGTSGQKVALNGGINCSILDGWWREGYRQGGDEQAANGWAIGQDRSLEQREAQDRQDAESLYRLLEQEIIPLYYNRDEGEFSLGWIEMMKASIKTVAPVFNTERMLGEYVRKMYLPQRSKN
ncbi:alpha-glucan family phosphorylase [Myxosarcina sp. GI1(2024)]